MSRTLHVLGLAAVSSVCLTDNVCLAGTARQKAVAAVAVARAALEIADERPELPDVSRLNRRSTQAVSSIGGTISEVISNGSDAQGVPEMFVASPPIRIEITKAEVLSEFLPAQLVIAGWEVGCPACIRLERDVKSILTPLGWTIGNRPADQIQFVHVPQSEAVPQITLIQNGKVITTWNSYVDPGVLSQALREAWDKSPSLEENTNFSARAGVAGNIHARTQIQEVLSWWRKSIGKEVDGSICWDRSGAQNFPLLADGDWSASAVFGMSGHFELSAKGAIGLPIDSIGFGYQIRGQDLLLDADPIILAGLAARLNPSVNQQAICSVPSKYSDPLIAWNILSLVRSIYQLLHPSCDLHLPGQVSARANLIGDTLIVDFQQGPSITLVALFTFQLQVKRIEITETSVRVLFSGSRFVKERTFSVR
jgi:hypothetical protein